MALFLQLVTYLRGGGGAGCSPIHDKTIPRVTGVSSHDQEWPGHPSSAYSYNKMELRFGRNREL